MSIEKDLEQIHLEIASASGPVNAMLTKRRAIVGDLQGVRLKLERSIIYIDRLIETLDSKSEKPNPRSRRSMETTSKET
jgi:hypothetical protein